MDPVTDGPFIQSLMWLLVLAMGLCLGSFSSAMIHRIPLGESWIFSKNIKGAARSACTSCRHPLAWFDLVPLISWLSTAGKCRYCKARISISYPLLEIAATVAVSVLYAVWGFSLSSLFVLCTVPFLLAAMVIDWRHMILPDDINIALTVLACLFLFSYGFEHHPNMAGFWAEHVFAAVSLSAGIGLLGWIIGKIKGRDALGWGDVKFLFPAGLFLGFSPLPFFLITAGFLGLVTGALHKYLYKNQIFAFGPALILSLYIHLFLTGMRFDYMGVVY